MTQPTETQKSSGWFTPFLMVACIALGATVVMMNRTIARQSADRATLRAELEVAQSKLADALGMASLRVSEPVKSLVLEDGAGNRTERRFDGGNGSTMMLVVSGGCEVCAEAGPVWATLLAGPHEGWDVVEVSVDTMPTGDAGGLGAAGVGKFLAVDARSTPLGGVRLVPATILIGPDGIVTGVWYGLLNESTMREVAEALAGG